MPDYGIRGPGEGTGLLPWSWNLAADPRCVVTTEDTDDFTGSPTRWDFETIGPG